MPTNLDRSLGEIIGNKYGPSRGNRSKQRSAPYASEKGTRVHIGNLSWSTKWQDLKDACQEFGDVRRADIAEENGRSKGYALVSFSTVEGAEACIQGLDGESFDGRNVTVKFDEKQSNFGGSRGRSTGGGRGTHVFVNNLSWSTRWQDLKDLCKEFGDVTHVNIEEENGRSKGMAVVSFTNSRDAQACIRGLNGYELDGRELNAKLDDKNGGQRVSRNVGSTNAGRGTHVFVNNLPWSTTWQDLKDLCREEFGPVTNVNLEEENGRSKGMAVVSFTNSRDAQACIRGLNGYELNGRELNAKMDDKNGGSRSQVFGAGNGTHVFVNNLSWSTTWQDLKDLCKEEFGDVSHVNLEEDNGRSRGMAVISFTNTRDAKACVRGLSGYELDGRELNAKLDDRNGERWQDARGSGMNKKGSNSGSNSVYVGNLPWSVKWQDLKDMCKEFGNVLRADIEQDDEGKSRGFGIVKFATQRSAQSCIEQLNGEDLDGRQLNVRFDNYN